jgi:drug/metabolite transporter (DMT)-like permease
MAGWRTDKVFILGYLMALAAGASYGATNVMAKQVIEIYDSPLMVTAFSMLIGLFVLAPLVGASAARTGVLRAGHRSLGQTFHSLRFVAMAGLASGIAVNALYFAVQKADVVVISPIVASSPLVTLLLAHIFLARLETVTRKLVAGTLMAVLGVVLVVVGSQL